MTTTNEIIIVPPEAANAINRRNIKTVRQGLKAIANPATASNINPISNWLLLPYLIKLKH